LKQYGTLFELEMDTWLYKTT